jgi:uncharacterized repeat protein (TIGR03837 family)
MTAPDRETDWDIFCQVVDNYGDIGVCWRLARQLANEHGLAVRLWVDALDSFARICPQLDPRLDRQWIGDVEVRRWIGNFDEIEPGDVVIEAFACQLPEAFIERMARRKPRPAWVNLEYLSAEAWTLGCHTLPSPHPRLPLTKYFFFPGFSERSGGLLREAGLESRRGAFCAAREEQADFWRTIGASPREGAFLISLFAYENAALAALLAACETSRRPVCCLAPLTRTLPQVEAYAGRTLRAGDVVRRGMLEIRILPFVAQDDYDRLLWSCDINFVRGEDSFVRAQWAARPMVWHIYPQADDAHLVKLVAFLDLYCAGLSAAAADAVRRLHQAWNGEPALLTPALWGQWLAAFDELREHATKWTNSLSKQEDLCGQLVRFCRSKL